MFINNHKLNVTISLLLARVDRPAHILGCMKMISQLMVNFAFRLFGLSGIPENPQQLPLLRMEFFEHFGNNDFIRAALEWESLSLMST